MKRWYDGYLFGDTEVYNPWSVLNQVKTWARNKEAFALPWWANTSSNSIIKTLVERSDDETKAIVELLLHDGSVIIFLDVRDTNYLLDTLI